MCFNSFQINSYTPIHKTSILQCQGQSSLRLFTRRTSQQAYEYESTRVEGDSDGGWGDIVSVESTSSDVWTGVEQSAENDRENRSWGVTVDEGKKRRHCVVNVPKGRRRDYRGRRQREPLSRGRWTATLLSMPSEVRSGEREEWRIRKSSKTGIHNEV